MSVIMLATKVANFAFLKPDFEKAVAIGLPMNLHFWKLISYLSAAYKCNVTLTHDDSTECVEDYKYYAW